MPDPNNNLVERALKRAVLHRKNALFYRTLNGAEVGDLFMSLIHTCHLCDANSFDYLTELQRHAQIVRSLKLVPCGLVWLRKLQLGESGQALTARSQRRCNTDSPSLDSG